ncbi:hypothetical protein GCM10010272_69410 [Streptomyces lateritius]|nr:hypothetical protein GCM10010272_69410 [Streptomyces lateritius]
MVGQVQHAGGDPGGSCGGGGQPKWSCVPEEAPVLFATHPQVHFRAINKQLGHIGLRVSRLCVDRTSSGGVVGAVACAVEVL